MRERINARKNRVTWSFLKAIDAEEESRSLKLNERATKDLSNRYFAAIFTLHFCENPLLRDVIYASKPVCSRRLTSDYSPDFSLSQVVLFPWSLASECHTLAWICHKSSGCVAVLCLYFHTCLLSSSKKETFYLVVRRGRFPRSGVALLCDGVFRKQHYRWGARNESETEKYEQKDRKAVERR